MMEYTCLTQQQFTRPPYSLVPIRERDKLLIMQWRNEQVYHLRQHELLTIEDQEKYFREVVSKLFIQPLPSQILFSYLHHDTCIGYGGLVHINWKDKHAELSFIMDTKLEKDEFSQHWKNFLTLVEEVGFSVLGFHKLFTYAFDLRPHLYQVLENQGFSKEAVLKEHCFYNGNFIDVIIHSKTEGDVK